MRDMGDVLDLSEKFENRKVAANRRRMLDFTPISFNRKEADALLNKAIIARDLCVGMWLDAGVRENNAFVFRSNSTQVLLQYDISVEKLGELEYNIYFADGTIEGYTSFDELLQKIDEKIDHVRQRKAMYKSALDSFNNN